jgi:carbon monoxide dehydrogenase subunit G
MTDTNQEAKGRTYHLEEVRTISRPLDEVFAYTADFSHSAEWDPGVESSEQVGAGSVQVGTRYRLVGNFGPTTIPMDYEVLEYDPPNKVMLFGKGTAFDSRDTLTFDAASDSSATVNYQADITIYNFLRFLGPLMNRPLRRMGEEALDGLVATLER